MESHNYWLKALQTQVCSPTIIFGDTLYSVADLMVSKWAVADWSPVKAAGLRLEGPLYTCVFSCFFMCYECMYFVATSKKKIICFLGSYAAHLPAGPFPLNQPLIKRILCGRALIVECRFTRGDATAAFPKTYVHESSAPAVFDARNLRSGNWNYHSISAPTWNKNLLVLQIISFRILKFHHLCTIIWHLLFKII